MESGWPAKTLRARWCFPRDHQDGTHHLGGQEGNKAQARLPPERRFQRALRSAKEPRPEVAELEAKEEQVMSCGHDGPQHCV